MAPSGRQKPPKRDRIDLLSGTMDTTKAISAPPALSSTPSNAFKTLLASVKVRQAKTTFLSLPAEIRNVIYSYVLYHSDNGIISSPTSPGPPSFSLSVISRIQTQISAMNGPFVSQTLLAPTEMEDDDEEDDLSHPNEQCTHECLLQRAITRVSRLLRTEALLVFYNINTFEFDAAKYRNLGAGSHNLPKKWWRAIGDTNLRAIKSFRLADHLGGVNEETLMKFHFTYTESKDSKIVHVRLKDSGEFWRFGQRCPGWDDCIKQLKVDGLFVRGIERMAAAAGYEAFETKVDEDEWPENPNVGEVLFEGWGGEHHAYVGREDVGVAGF